MKRAEKSKDGGQGHEKYIKVRAAVFCHAREGDEGTDRADQR